MTVIDKISFRFRMADEQFARNLYADWDGFCRRCVTDILEEFFSKYDNKGDYIEVDRLDLDLGSIPQEKFYDEFPARLRETLERNFVPFATEQPLASSDDEGMAAGILGRNAMSLAEEKSFENLLHYLKHGFCFPEWAGSDFGLYEEVRHFMEKADFRERLCAVLAGHSQAFARLLLQLESHQTGKILSGAVGASDAVPLHSLFFSPSFPAGQRERQRMLALMLEHVPQEVVRFIHGTRESGSLDSMAELLENPHVRRIMAAETEHHAEVGLPEYWYRLYGWLLEYYPFNGVPMFGDKRHFRLHLNRSLLSFIHKRTYSAYISKAGLTVQFLQEVFGTDYCLTVLDIIYRRQRLNPDGSPESGDSYVWELYYMLLRLSLIEPAQQGTEQHKAVDDGAVSGVSAEPLAALMDRRVPFSTWLEDANIPHSAKRDLLERLARENPESLLHWIKGRPDKGHLRLLASLLTGTPALTWLSGSVSLLLAETVSSLMDRLDKLQADVSWLKGTKQDKLETIFTLSILSGIADNTFSASDTVNGQLLRIAESLYKEITEMEVIPADRNTVPGQLLEFVGVLSSAGMETDDGTQTHNIQDIPDKASASENGYGISSLQELLSGNHVPEAAKRRILLQWFDTYRGDEARFLSALDAGHLMESVVRILGGTMLRQTVMRMAADRLDTYGTVADGTPVLLLDWLTDNMADIAEIFSRTETDLWISLLRWMADSKGIRNTVSDNGAMDAASLLLRALDVGREITTDRLDRLAALTMHRSYSRTGAEVNVIPAFLSHIRKRTLSARRTDMDDARTAFERSLDGTDDIGGWLRTAAYTSEGKREVFRHAAAEQPGEVCRLIRESFASDKGTMALWGDIAEVPALLALIRHTDGALADVLANTVRLLETSAYESGLFSGESAGLEHSLAEALLLFIATETDIAGMNAQTAVRRFISYWHRAVTGQEDYPETDRERWEKLEQTAVDALQDGITVIKDITGETENYTGEKDTKSGTADYAEDSGYKSQDTLSGNVEETDDALLAEQLAWLMSPSVSDTAKSQRLRHYARWQPELLWRLMRQAAVTASSDSPDASIPFRQWASWLGREALLETVSENSLSLAETLRQTMEALAARYGIGETELTEALAVFMARHSSGRTYYADSSAIVREYIAALNRIGAMPAMQISGEASATDSSGQESAQAQTTEADKSLSATMDNRTSEGQVLVEQLVEEMEAALHLKETEKALKEAAQPEYIEVPNAGLCLLALWLPRLFDMLGLLETGADGKKDFRDTDARIRAIFVLQRLVTDEKREYKEQELAFNRILAACPFSVPLPKTLELTDTELQTVESMLAGVKSNWNKLKGTSVKGFQRSFIERPGKLEQREDKWVLYVEERSYDILLDSLPWSYRRIRLPWLKKRMDVVWRDKEEFDFENYNN